jgi:phosphonate transport system substrate-binding protein
MDNSTLLLGAVAYDPKVVTIWDGFQAWFRVHDLSLDYVLYSNYERQVEALLSGEIDVAWNSPLAWLRASRMARARGDEARAMVMRDTDQDLVSIVLARSDSEIRRTLDLRGRRVGVGAIDSPQATLIPLSHLRKSGLTPDVDFEVCGHNESAGKHGDHVGGERDAARGLMKGDVDAICILDSNHNLFTREGSLTPGSTRVVTQTEPYDHCNFTSIASGAAVEATARFEALLLKMSYGDAAVRSLLDLEGLKEWRAARTTKYAALDRAIEEAKFYDESGRVTATDYRY